METHRSPALAGEPGCCLPDLHADIHLQPLDRLRRIIVPVVCFMLGATFLVSAGTKAVQPDATLAALNAIFGTGLAETRVLLRLLLAVEITLAALLLSGVARRWVLAATLIILLAFTAWIVYLAVTSATIGCGCGLTGSWLKPGAERVVALIRNALLLGLVTTALISARRGRPQMAS